MNKTKIIILCSVLLLMAAQVYAPVSMMLRYEHILDTGTPFRFAVEPIDPADPFKGRYVRLNFPIQQGLMSDLEQPIKKNNFVPRGKAYAILSTNDDGLAMISKIVASEPNDGDYVAVKSRYFLEEKYSIRFPFDRYYAEESKAPKIESLVWNWQGDENQGQSRPAVIAQVHIKNGHGVISELYVDDIPILDYLEN